ncbi:MAG: PAS domain S-box protein, partial [Oceanospirillales bacterium]|nr:PAS domain S-box protein [Oceanospirillales bacterium]
MTLSLSLHNHAYLRRVSAFILVLCTLILFPAHALGAREPGFNQVFQGTDIPMLLIDPAQGNIIRANDAATKFYGYSAEQLKQRSIQQINTFTPEQVAAERRQAMMEGRNFFIFRHQLADGDIRTVEVYSHPYTFGGQTLLLSLIHDITPGRHAEQDLWHYQNTLEQMVDVQVEQIAHSRDVQVWILAGATLAQALAISWLVRNIRRRRQLEKQRKQDVAALELNSVRLKEAQRIARTGSWTLDHKHREWTCTEEMYRILGLDPGKGSVSYREALGCIHPDDRAQVAQAFSQAVASHTLYDINHRLLLRDGGIRYVHVIGENHYADDGSVVVTLGTVQDMTEQQLTQNALSALATEFATLSGEDFYRAVCRHLADALGLEYVFVAQLAEGREGVDVLAGWTDAGAMLPFGYSLKGTPCADLVAHDVCIHPQDIQSLYPDDLLLSDMGVTAYIGSTLKDKQQRSIGLLVGLSKQKLSNTELAYDLLQLFVDRVSAEMQRSQEESRRLQADQYRQIVLKFSSRFINLPLNEVDTAIEEAMREISLFIGADRCYLFEYDFAAGVVRNTHNWCKPGVLAYTNDEPMALDSCDAWVQQHLDGKAVMVGDISQLDDGPLVQILKSLGVKSLLDLPLTLQGRCIGVIGVDSAESTYQFGPQTVELLGLFAELLANLKLRQESESQLRLSASVFDNANEGIMIIDVDGCIARVNAAFTQTTGYTAEEATGRDAAFLSMDQGDPHHQVQWETLRGEGRWSGEVWNRHKDGMIYAVLQ